MYEKRINGKSDDENYIGDEKKPTLRREKSRR